MPREPITSLGLNPGTRFIGIAVIRDGDLKDWRILGFPGRWSAEKLKRILSVLTPMIGKLRPTVVSIKTPHASRTSDGLDRVVDRIASTCKGGSVRLLRFSTKEIMRGFGPLPHRNKTELASFLAERYPVIRAECDAERRNRNPYHARVFEAVALAHLAYHQLDRKGRKHLLDLL